MVSLNHIGVHFVQTYRNHWVLLGLGAVAVAVAATAFVLAPGATGTGTDHGLRPDDTAVVARGQSIYRSHCASCHGARLERQPNWRERGADERLPDGGDHRPTALSDQS
jgi:mono/diheme cytochrome c family protein